jgi:FkbM family methyltransferase
VGANAGQYAHELRLAGYTGRIVSFEPLAEPFAQLAQAAARDAAWEAVNCALGAQPAEEVMNVAANGGQSSSLLPMLALHEQAAPQAMNVAVEVVTVRVLDDFLDRHAGCALHVKADVQGFEKRVLEGGPETVRLARSIELELSLAPVYEGAMTFSEGLDLMTSDGFELVDVEPVFAHPGTGDLLQVNGMFRRPR